MIPVKEGFVSFRGMSTWYRILGDLDGHPAGKLPLLLLHGGPGQPSDYFEPLEVLAGAGRPVVTYDQIGCGRSDRPADPALWTMETFVDELRTVRRSLALDRVHLLGHSWGGMLALEYVLAKPAGVASLVLASSLFSTRLFNDEARRLEAELPDYARRAIGRIRPSAGRGTRKPATKLKPGMPTKTADRHAAVLRAAYPVMANPALTRLACRAAAVPFLGRVAYPAAGMEFMRRHTTGSRPGSGRGRCSARSPA
jgi:pimeloyl-ACP methyl ester carboxylesterase